MLFIVEPEKRKTLHPDRAFALFRGDPMHRSLRQVSKLKVDLLGSSSGKQLYHSISYYILHVMLYDSWDFMRKFDLLGSISVENLVVSGF